MFFSYLQECKQKNAIDLEQNILYSPIFIKKNQYGSAHSKKKNPKENLSKTCRNCFGGFFVCFLGFFLVNDTLTAPKRKKIISPPNVKKNNSKNNSLIP